MAGQGRDGGQAQRSAGGKDEASDSKVGVSREDGETSTEAISESSAGLR